MIAGLLYVLRVLISISISSGAQGAVVVCIGSDLEEAEDWSFLMKEVVVVLVDLALFIVS